MTKVYLLFGLEIYYPSGGFEDLIFKTLDESEAIKALTKEGKNTRYDRYDALELFSIEGLTIKKYDSSTGKWIDYLSFRMTEGLMINND